MIAGYSDCHFAEIMKPGASEIGRRCSFCGKFCVPTPPPCAVTANIELLLRRWKNNDYSSEEMMNRVNDELLRDWQQLFTMAKRQLQKDGTPKYSFSIENMRWEDSTK